MVHQHHDRHGLCLCFIPQIPSVLHKKPCGTNLRGHLVFLWLFWDGLKLTTLHSSYNANYLLILRPSASPVLKKSAADVNRSISKAVHDRRLSIHNTWMISAVSVSLDSSISRWPFFSLEKFRLLIPSIIICDSCEGACNRISLTLRYFKERCRPHKNPYVASPPAIIYHDRIRIRMNSSELAVRSRNLGEDLRHLPLS